MSQPPGPGGPQPQWDARSGRWYYPQGQYPPPPPPGYAAQPPGPPAGPPPGRGQPPGPPAGPPPGRGQPPQPPRKGRKWPWIVGGAVALIVIISVSTSGGGDSSAPVAAAPAKATTTSAPAAASKVPAAADGPPGGYGKASGHFGDEIVAGDLAVTANAPKAIKQMYLGTQYCATVSYRNTGGTPESFNMFDWKFRTAQGVEANANIPFNASKALHSGNLAPGGKVSGQVCADNTVTDVTSVVYSPGFGIMHEVAWSK